MSVTYGRSDRTGVVGVTYIRMKMTPQAECVNWSGCVWTVPTWALSPQEIRNEAKKHVKETGHHVEVRVVDITRYEPRDE